MKWEFKENHPYGEQNQDGRGGEACMWCARALALRLSEIAAYSIFIVIAGPWLVVCWFTQPYDQCQGSAILSGKGDGCLCVCVSRYKMLWLARTLTFPPHICMSTEVRCAESAKIRGKYQDRIPVSNWKLYHVFCCWWYHFIVPSAHDCINSLNDILLGDCWEGTEIHNSRYRQEKISRPSWSQWWVFEEPVETWGILQSNVYLLS